MQEKILTIPSCIYLSKLSNFVMNSELLAIQLSPYLIAAIFMATFFTGTPRSYLLYADMAILAIWWYILSIDLYNNVEHGTEATDCKLNISINEKKDALNLNYCTENGATYNFEVKNLSSIRKLDYYEDHVILDAMAESSAEFNPMIDMRYLDSEQSAIFMSHDDFKKFSDLITEYWGRKWESK